MGPTQTSWERNIVWKLWDLCNSICLSKVFKTKNAKEFQCLKHNSVHKIYSFQVILCARLICVGSKIQIWRNFWSKSVKKVNLKSGLKHTDRVSGFLLNFLIKKNAKKFEMFETFKHKRCSFSRLYYAIGKYDFLKFQFFS